MKPHCERYHFWDVVSAPFFLFMLPLSLLINIVWHIAYMLFLVKLIAKGESVGDKYDVITPYAFKDKKLRYKK
jgi:hypothetical protein